ncbi:hypothetical protein HNQ99_000617 [Rhizorhapis suberifaciens]|uniref:Uncharacterized protein n=1 Tax=Rhizorhapis suberifaciens TaxID=13656 RepID=A0A840HRS5_9SPHN|nr:hypothetical protein [Rhizorhapis suberifaciens]
MLNDVPIGFARLFGMHSTDAGVARVRLDFARHERVCLPSKIGFVFDRPVP